MGGRGSILRLPEEMICVILRHLPLVSIARIEQTCKHLRTVIIHARVWRKRLDHKLEFEPGLRGFLQGGPAILLSREADSAPFPAPVPHTEQDSLTAKQQLQTLKLKIDLSWISASSPSIARTNRVFGVFEEEHFLYQIISTGRHFLSFWGPMKTEPKIQRDYIIDVFDREDNRKVKRISELQGKPDIVRVVSELQLLLVSYAGLLMVETVMLDCVTQEDRTYLDLAGRLEPETGSVCDIVVREWIAVRGTLHRRYSDC